MKHTILLVGADKGGVGKTTLSRALLDFFARKDISAKAFDTEHPRGSLKRFHPTITEVIDFTNVAHQMKVLDGLDTTDSRVTLVDLKAGNLSVALDTLDRVGVLEAARNGQINIGLFHLVGPAISSLEEIGEVAGYVNGLDYVVARSFINETNFFNGIKRLTKNTSRGSVRRRKWTSRSSMRWPTNKSIWPVYPSRTLSITRTLMAVPVHSHLFCEVMCGNGAVT